jgi:hypothetical protein
LPRQALTRRRSPVQIWAGPSFTWPQFAGPKHPVAEVVSGLHTIWHLFVVWRLAGQASSTAFVKISWTGKPFEFSARQSSPLPKPIQCIDDLPPPLLGPQKRQGVLEEAFLLKVAQEFALSGPLSFDSAFHYVACPTKARMKAKLPQVFPNASNYILLHLRGDHDSYPHFFAIFGGKEHRTLCFEPINYFCEGPRPSRVLSN